jgi:phosphate transport system protein
MAIDGGVSSSLRRIEEQVAQMAAFVEELIARSLHAMTHADDRLADEVIANDLVVDEMRGQVRQAVIQTIEHWAPVGVILRRLIAYQFIADQLERIGDYAVHVARGARISYRTMPLAIAGKMSEMARIVRQHVRDGVRALADSNVELARQVCSDDNRIDICYKELLIMVQDYLREHPEMVTEATLIIFALRDLERIGDRMANVSEDVIYIQTGIHEELN